MSSHYHQFDYSATITFLHFFTFYTCIVQMVFLPWEIQVYFPRESKLQQLHYPTYGACWVLWCFHNPLNSDFDYGIFNVLTDINPWNCIQECTDTRKRVCTESWLGEKSLVTPGNRTCVSSVLVQCSINWAASPPISNMICTTVRSSFIKRLIWDCERAQDSLCVLCTWRWDRHWWVCTSADSGALKSILHPATTRSQTLATGFLVRCVSQLSTSPCQWVNAKPHSALHLLEKLWFFHVAECTACGMSSDFSSMGWKYITECRARFPQVKVSFCPVSTLVKEVDWKVKQRWWTLWFTCLLFFFLLFLCTKSKLTAPAGRRNNEPSLLELDSVITQDAILFILAQIHQLLITVPSASSSSLALRCVRSITA